MSPSSFSKYPCHSWYSLRELSAPAVASCRCQQLALLMVSLNRDYTVRLLFFLHQWSICLQIFPDGHASRKLSSSVIYSSLIPKSKNNVPISPSFPSTLGDIRNFSSFQGLLYSMCVTLITVADSRCRGAAHLILEGLCVLSELWSKGPRLLPVRHG